MARDEMDEDAHRGDTLHFDVPPVGQSTVRKFLLQNAFLRHALAAHPHQYSYIARADDDAVANVSEIASALAALTATLPPKALVTLGPFDHWSVHSTQLNSTQLVHSGPLNSTAMSATAAPAASSSRLLLSRGCPLGVPPKPLAGPRHGCVYT